MKCKHIEKKLAIRSTLNSKEVAHINSCPSCAQYAQDVRQFAALDFKTPAWTKMHTRNRALSVIESGSTVSFLTTRKPDTVRRVPRKVVGLIIIFATMLLTSIGMQFFCDETNPLCYWAGLFLFLILVQNMMTALFIPVLLSKKIQRIS